MPTRTTWCPVIILAAALTPGALTAADPNPLDKKSLDREQEWVRKFAADFFEVALSAGSDSDYSTSLASFLSADLNAGLKDKPPDAALPRMAWQFSRGTFKLTDVELSPNGSEAVVRGVLTPATPPADPEQAKKEAEKAKGEANLAKLFAGIDLGELQEKPAAVTVRLAKDAEAGRWQVRFVRVKLATGEKAK